MSKDRERSQQYHRWQHWQETPISQRLLSEKARHNGYTVVQVHPPSRPAFLDVVALLTLYSELVRKYPSRLTSTEVYAMEAWQQGTRQLLEMLRKARDAQH